MSLQCYNCKRFIKSGRRIVADGIKYVCSLPEEVEQCQFICDTPKREQNEREKKIVAKKRDERQSRLAESKDIKLFKCVECAIFMETAADFDVIEIHPAIYICRNCFHRYDAADIKYTLQN